MPDADTLKAFASCIDSFRQLFRALGAGWTFLLALVVLGPIFALIYLRSRESDKPWERVLAAKDQMIEQLNQQNRELRVQALVMGGQFTQEQATRLVYGDDRLGQMPASSGNSKP